MTKISAQVIADSKNEFGNRITTMVVTFPRFILAELNTHRMLSKNSASSRAIPFEKMVKAVEENPFIPIAWQKDHKGMQGTEYFTDKDSIEFATDMWLEARYCAVRQANALSGNALGLTKQLCNRLLEPFMWHTVIITGTEWENFFALRCPRYLSSDGNTYRSKKETPEYQWSKVFTDLDWLKLNKGQAEIHMMALAEAMWDAMNESTPKELKAGEWHIPFGDNINEEQLYKSGVTYGFDIQSKKTFDDLRIKIATARCARVSYTVVGEEGKEPNYENDIKLHDNLLKAGHMSPFEHCAMVPKTYKNNGFEDSGNFRGFIQYRKTLPNENITR